MCCAWTTQNPDTWEIHVPYKLIVAFLILQEGFAFAHCTTCMTPYYLRVHTAHLKWRTLKFQFFVTRDVLFVLLAMQLVGHWDSCFNYFSIFSPFFGTFYVKYYLKGFGIKWNVWKINFQPKCSGFRNTYSSLQVIASLAYLVYLIDGYEKFWLRLTCGFGNILAFYYICGKTSWAY